MRIVGGKWKGRALSAPKDRHIRPTSERIREALFSILTAPAKDHLGGRLEGCLEGRYVLDLFAGTGALGFEALSRGARHCLFVDAQASAGALLRENTHNLEAQDLSKIYRHDATRLGMKPAHIKTIFNLVFVDPPYGKGLAEKALICAYEGGWLALDVVIIVEEDKRSGFVEPAPFRLFDERVYGDTVLYFLVLADEVLTESE